MQLNLRCVPQSRARVILVPRRCASTLDQLFRVDETATDVYIQSKERLFIPRNRNSVFGGQIIGSAMNAAQQTVPNNCLLHSAHSYFVTAPRNTSPIFYNISRLRDGKSFATRVVTATQNEQVVFQSSLSFHRREKGDMEHQVVSPHAGRCSSRA